MNIGKGEWFGHVQKYHKEHAKAGIDKARTLAIEHKISNSENKRTRPSKNGSHSDATGTAVKSKVAEQLGETVSVFITPRAFQMCSTLLWQAREAAIREWNWPADITPEDFLHTFLYESFKQHGIILGGYQVVSKAEDGGHGHN